MNNNVQIFNFNQNDVRTVVIDNEPWFVARDIAKVLEYSNPRKAIIDHVDQEDKRDGVTIRDSIGRNQKPIIINESGLYSLVLSSKTPKAKEFKRWVTSEVLPALRKTGGYIVGEEQMSEDELILTAMNVLRRKVDALTLQNQKQAKQIEQMKDKTTYYDVVLQSPGLVTTTTIAKDFGLTAAALNQILKSKGIQYKLGKIWHLTKDYAAKGYAQSKTYVYDNSLKACRVSTQWTQKGRRFIYDVLKEDGILPIMERPS